MSRVLTKLKRLEQVKYLLLSEPDGVRLQDIGDLLEVDYTTAFRYVQELGAEKVKRGHYRLLPSDADIQLAHAILQVAKQRPQLGQPDGCDFELGVRLFQSGFTYDSLVHVIGYTTNRWQYWLKSVRREYRGPRISLQKLERHIEIIHYYEECKSVAKTATVFHIAHGHAHQIIKTMIPRLCAWEVLCEVRRELTQLSRE